MRRRRVADIHIHRFTQKLRCPNYMSNDLNSVVREASKYLRESRAYIIAKHRRLCIPLPGSTRGKQDTLVRFRQELEYEPSILSQEVDVDMHDDEAVYKEGSEDLRNSWKEPSDFGDNSTKMVDSDHDKCMKRSTDEEGGSDVNVNGFPMAEPDDFDIEMARVFGDTSIPEVRAPQEEPELSAPDIDLAGKEPGKSGQPPTSVPEYPKLVIAETLDMTVSIDDLRVTAAAKILLDIYGGNANVSEIDSVDSESLKKAFGTSDDLQPSTHREEPSTSNAIPRSASFSDHFETMKLLARDTIPPSKEFKSFFATRRLRKNILRQDEKSWNDEDQAFIVSGRTIEAPGAQLGAEFVAKSLLDVSITASLTPIGMI